jgi:hypothetical protein
MDEVWVDIKDYEGQYQVSNTGYVKSVKRNRILKATNVDGYLQISLSDHGHIKKCLIHRLVAEAFIPNCNNLPYVNHRDENTMNNSVENLEWCTLLYNSNYGSRNSRISESHRHPNPPERRKIKQECEFVKHKTYSIMTDIKNHIQRLCIELKINNNDAHELQLLYDNMCHIVNQYIESESLTSIIQTLSIVDDNTTK